MANGMVIGGAVLSAVVLLAGAGAVKQNTGPWWQFTPSWAPKPAWQQASQAPQEWPPGTPAWVKEKQALAVKANDPYFPCIANMAQGMMRVSRAFNENPPLTEAAAQQHATRNCALIFRPWVFDSK